MGNPIVEILISRIPDFILSAALLYGFLSGHLRTKGEVDRIKYDCDEKLKVAMKAADQANTRADASDEKMEELLREDIRIAREREHTTQLLLQAATQGKAGDGR